MAKQDDLKYVKRVYTGSIVLLSLYCMLCDEMNMIKDFSSPIQHGPPKKNKG